MTKLARSPATDVHRAAKEAQTITKKVVFHAVAGKTRVAQQEVNAVCQALLDEIILELKRGHRLEFRDFGVFEIKERAARTAQNPKTLQKLLVPAKRAVKFKVGRLMRESVEKQPIQRKPDRPALRNSHLAGEHVQAATELKVAGEIKATAIHTAHAPARV